MPQQLGSEQNSRCTALVVKQTKSAAYTFTLVGFCGLPLWTKKGPAKSIPVLLNGGAGSVLNRGSMPIR